MISQQEKKELKEASSQLVKKASSIAMKYYGRGNKNVPFDVDHVTEVELEITGFIKEEIKNNFKSHKILGEDISPEDGFTWVFDALDGVAMYSRELPVWGIGAALFYNKDLVVGAFYMPVTDELYSGIHNEAGELNGERINVVARDIDNESLLLTYSRFHEDFTTEFPGKIRSLGSSLAQLCYVARGAASAVILKNIHIWDVAPAMAVVTGAGGIIFTLNGKEFLPEKYMKDTKINEPLIGCGQFILDQLKSYIKPK